MAPTDVDFTPTEDSEPTLSAVETAVIADAEFASRVGKEYGIPPGVILEHVSRVCSHQARNQLNHVCERAVEQALKVFGSHEAPAPALTDVVPGRHPWNPTLPAAD